MGHVKFKDHEVNKFVAKIEDAPFWSDVPNREGLSIMDALDPSNALDWSKPSNSQQMQVQEKLKEDHALKVISDAVRLTAKKGWYTHANKIFSSMRTLTYDYLKGLTKYGETAGQTRTVNNKDEWFLPEIKQAHAIGMIDNKQMGTLESMFNKVIAEEQVKKKL